MLNAYLQQTQRLLANPTSSLYNTSDLTFYINSARGQLAGEGECIRVIAPLSTTSGTRSYAFSSVVTAFATTQVSGIQGVLAVRMINLVSSGGTLVLDSRPWEWINNYYLSNPQPPGGPTRRWAQYGQGALGTIVVDPIPDQVYTLNLDTVCYPIALALDTDPEAIPYPWTDAVPYYAAYLAYYNAQRAQDAENMRMQYENFVQRARQITTPTVLPSNFPGNAGAQIVSQKIPLTGQSQPRQAGRGR